MSAFGNVETLVLIDMLARNTLQLTELFMKKDMGEEYQYYKQVIHDLQTEIERRRRDAHIPSLNTRNRTNNPGNDPSAF